MKMANIFEVTEDQLEALDEATDNAQKHLAFFCVASGVLLPLVFTYPVGEHSAFRVGLHISGLIWSAIFSLWFGLSWNKSSRKRKSLLNKLRSTDGSRNQR